MGHNMIRGLPYVTSAVGGQRGSPKSRQKEQNQLICESDIGGSQKIRKFCGCHIWKPREATSALLNFVKIPPP